MRYTQKALITCMSRRCELVLILKSWRIFLTNHFVIFAEVYEPRRQSKSIVGNKA